MFISFIFKRIPIDFLYVHALDKRLDTTKGNWKKIIIKFDLLDCSKIQEETILLYSGYKLLRSFIVG